MKKLTLGILIYIVWSIGWGLLTLADNQILKIIGIVINCGYVGFTVPIIADKYGV